MKKDFSYPISVDAISQKEKRYSIEASDDDRKVIAEILKVPAVDFFTAKYIVKGYKKSTLVEVKGEYSAVIVQNCIVSLEDFEKEYSGEFRVMYDSKSDNQLNGEDESNIIEFDAPEGVLNNEIDLVHVALEQLSLSLDDYPKKEGVEFKFESEFSDDDVELNKKNPFEVLARLKE
jgi:uncharacterized metal-binding protein YceD (DUF177 family)